MDSYKGLIFNDLSLLILVLQNLSSIINVEKVGICYESHTNIVVIIILFCP